MVERVACRRLPKRSTSGEQRCRVTETIPHKHHPPGESPKGLHTFDGGTTRLSTGGWGNSRRRIRDVDVDVVWLGCSLLPLRMRYQKDVSSLSFVGCGLGLLGCMRTPIVRVHVKSSLPRFDEMKKSSTSPHVRVATGCGIRPQFLCFVKGMMSEICDNALQVRRGYRSIRRSGRFSRPG